jgi:hypothetical protein
MSLPERESADAWFTVFYANALGKNIIEKNPSIRSFIQAWKKYQHPRSAIESSEK